MSLEQISYLSQIVASLAVVASLVYAAIQLRMYTKAARESRLVAASSDIQEFRRMLASDPNCARIFSDGLADLSQLDKVEQLRFHAMMQLAMTQVRYMSNFSDIPPEMAAAALWTQPGARQWWAAARTQYTPYMVALIDGRFAAAEAGNCAAKH